jgi:hypothetical protein
MLIMNAEGDRLVLRCDDVCSQTFEFDGLLDILYSTAVVNKLAYASFIAKGTSASRYILLEGIHDELPQDIKDSSEEIDKIHVKLSGSGGSKTMVVNSYTVESKMLTITQHLPKLHVSTTTSIFFI